MDIYKYIGIAVLALFLLPFAIAIWRGRKETKEWEALAGSMGFTIETGCFHVDDPQLAAFRHLALFRHGGNQDAWNIMHGTMQGVSVTIMGHRLGSASASNTGRNVQKQTLIIFQTEVLRLPSFTLRPEDTTHKLLTSMLGYRDINFDTHPLFSKQYHLHGSEEESIRDVFSDKVLAFFEQQKDLCTDGHEDLLLFYRQSQRVPPKEIASFIEQGVAVLRLFTGGAQARSLTE